MGIQIQSQRKKTKNIKKRKRKKKKIKKEKEIVNEIGIDIKNENEINGKIETIKSDENTKQRIKMTLSTTTKSDIIRTRKRKIICRDMREVILLRNHHDLHSKE